MAKKRLPRPAPKAETRTTFMFPWLHKDVKEATPNLKSRWVNKIDNDDKAIKEHPTHVMGKFRCTNDNCSTKGWGSKKVAILIKRYEKNGYSAVVFNQRCKDCEQLGTFTLDKQSYIDRVTYRIQKWAGIQVEQPHYDSKTSKPHKEELCEGCKRGVCRQAGIYD